MLQFNAVTFYEAMANLGAIQTIIVTAEQFSKSLDSLAIVINPKAAAAIASDSKPLNAEMVKIAKNHTEALHKELMILGTPLAALSVRRLDASLYKEPPPTEREFLNA